jgi:hypothetical protein
MWCGGVRCAFRAPMRPSRLSGVVAAVMLAALAAGCSSQQTGRFTSINAAVPTNATVAFESIDGPPPEVFRKLVTALNDEAGTRRVAVVSRGGPATYRVRGYVSALVDRDRTTFAWVWDVYDSDKRRALRITGEEPASAAPRRRDARTNASTNAWTAADDEVLRRMSRTGMERIAAFLNAPGQPPAIEPAPALPTLVAGRDDSPEAAGIFRIFGGSAPQTEPVQNPVQNPAQVPEAEAPKPAPPPAPPKRRSAAAKPATQSAALDR